MREDLKRRVWGIALSILVCFLSYPVVIGIELGNFVDSTVPLYGILRSIFTTTGPGFPMGYSIVAVGAVVLGLNSFYYLNSRKKVDLYHSIPVRRETLFAVNYIDGFLIYFVPYVVNMLLGLLVIGVNGYFSKVVFMNAIASILINSVFFLLLYTLVVIAALLTGNIVVSMLGTGVFFLYGFYLTFIQGAYYSKFFATFYDSTQVNNIFLRISPFNAYYTVIQTYTKDMYVRNTSVEMVINNVGKISSIGFTLINVFCLTLAFIAFALFLHQRRPSEAAGKAMAFELSKPIIKYLLVVPTSLAGGIVFDNLSNNSTNGWFFFGLIFIFFLSYAVIEIIYNFDMKSAFKGKVHLALSGATVLIIVLIFYHDLLGFDTYQPDKKDVKAMSIDVSGLDSYAWHKYRNSNRADKLDTMGISNFDELYELASIGIEELNHSSDLETNSDFNGFSRYVRIVIHYRLNGGKSVYREYFVPRDALYDRMQKVYNDEEFKKSHFPILTWDKNMFSTATIRTLYNEKELRLKEEDKKQFLEIYQQELESLTLKEVTEGNVSASILFYSPDGYEFTYMIYPSFVKTKAFLNSYGIELETGLSIEDIKEITVSMYGISEKEVYTEAMEPKGIAVSETAQNANIEEHVKIYADKESIEALLSSMIQRNYYYDNSTFIEIDSTFDVYVSYIIDGVENNNFIEHFAFREGEIPEFVLKDFDK